MSTNFRKLEKQLKAVANARRLFILRYLKKNKGVTVGEISKAARLRIQSTSQHLRILRSAGIIEYRRRGMFVAYRISLKQEEPIKKILSML